MQPGLYRLPEAPIGENVLIPGFRAAKSVRGAFGWFTAGWIRQLAHGLAEYLNRQDTTPITFTVAPIMYPRERDAIEAAQTMTAEEAAQRVAEVFIDGRLEADALGRHALDCLAWMLAAGRLYLRVAIPRPGSNYHPKLWLFDDGEHQVLVRGSANATGRGLDGAVEHMDVDVSWSEHGQRRVQGPESQCSTTGSTEEASALGTRRGHAGRPQRRNRQDRAHNATLHRGLLLGPSQGRAPSQQPRLERRATGEAALPVRSSGSPKIRLGCAYPIGWSGRPATMRTKERPSPRGSRPASAGTLAMATGAGKTLTALVCVARAQERIDEALLVIVSAPSVPLISQWREEIQHFGVEAATPTLAANTNSAITNLLRSLGAGRHTHSGGH